MRYEANKMTEMYVDRRASLRLNAGHCDIDRRAGLRLNAGHCEIDRRAGLRSDRSPGPSA